MDVDMNEEYPVNYSWSDSIPMDASVDVQMKSTVSNMEPYQDIVSRGRLDTSDSSSVFAIS